MGYPMRNLMCPWIGRRTSRGLSPCSRSENGTVPFGIRRRRGHPSRNGVTMVEMAIVLMVFLTLVLGMLDLGIAVFRHHVIAEAARQGARQAIVHGSLADKLGPWGPDTFSGPADTSSSLVDAIRPCLAGMDPAGGDHSSRMAGWRQRSSGRSSRACHRQCPLSAHRDVYLWQSNLHASSQLDNVHRALGRTACYSPLGSRQVLAYP